MEDDAVKKYQEVLEKYSADMSPKSTAAEAPSLSIEPPAPTPMISERTSQATTPPVASTSDTPVFIKILFALSLVAFFGVAATIGYNFYRSMNSAVSDNPVAALPTTVARPTIMGETCLLNDKNYKVGESFPSADGCNTCTCGSDLTIACTEKACETTPTVSTKPSPTSKAKASITPKITQVITPTSTMLSPKKQTLPSSLISVVKFNALKSSNADVTQNDVIIGDSILSGNFASVAYTLKDLGGSVFWLTKVDGSWQVVTGGQEPPACSLLAKYNFPKSFPCNQ